MSDRPGHDRRYAIDPSSMEGLGWQPRYTQTFAGLAATIDWYRDNQQWWEKPVRRGAPPRPNGKAADRKPASS